VHTSAETPLSPGPVGPSRLPVTAQCALLLCLAAAVCVIVAVAVPAFHKASRVSLLFQGCDSFCYSEMAASLRDARAAGRPVDYFLRDDQSEFLIAKFKQSGLPEDGWREAIAPHGYHYFHIPGQVGPQYPPGAPWALSFFPRNDAIHGLNRVSIVFIALMGLALAGWCAVRCLPLSCLAVAMATYAYLAIFTWVDLASFSVNATLAPLFAGIILAWFARERTHGALALLLALVGGVGIGMAAEDRIASVLLIPTMLLFFLPRRFGLIAAHAVGITLGGIAPLLLHNKLVTGGYFLPTYDTGDTEQSLKCIGANLVYYYQWRHQNSCWHVMILACALAALVVLVRFTARPPAGHWRRWMWGHAGLILAAPSAFLIGAAYFLTHVVKEGYYLTPSALTVALTTALLFVSLEIEWRAIAPAVSRRAALSWTAVVLAVAGAAVAIWENVDDFSDAAWAVIHPEPAMVVQFDLPQEMQDTHAWIWADYLSGSIRLYTGHPSFKIYSTSPETRKMIYGWIKARGEPQYLVEDTETMRRLIDEARQDGWKITLVGYIRDVPCFRMDAAP
jgi:hypothetical protein